MIENEVAGFWTVGMLKQLLGNYPDDTPISVCGTPGLFIPDGEEQHILLETMDTGEYPATDSQEYMDF